MEGLLLPSYVGSEDRVKLVVFGRSPQKRWCEIGSWDMLGASLRRLSDERLRQGGERP